ncbi:hypothetical protein GCM10027277_14760 [Pseudoduganella ginsengisoli]|uniref:Uncharacterized protein n=1 Tax=Pseudoduganella ginsengisoli TaxID=1462440 RepID=A0A6L6PUQ5_9BURK|nr:hypothetical protein [Pseudoduganella ginsengisoli]MTW01263.1 hypothetical protein [Pseudoduganella ginsengisoli]
MPAGAAHPELGYAAFVAIKFVGYTAGARFLNAWYGKRVNVWLLGGIRTLVGMVVGAVFYATMTAMSINPLGVYIFLIPVRILEWGVVIAPFYDWTLRDRARVLKYSATGTVLSFVLDIPAGIVGFISAGVWVC